MPTYSRRLIIEDLLDLQVFSSMNQLLKERVAINKDNLIYCENEIRILESNLKLQNEHLKSVAADIKQTKKDLEKKIKEQKQEDARQKKRIDMLLANRLKHEEKLSSFDVIEFEIKKIELAIDKLCARETKINSISTLSLANVRPVGKRLTKRSRKKFLKTLELISSLSQKITN